MEIYRSQVKKAAKIINPKCAECLAEIPDNATVYTIRLGGLGFNLCGPCARLLKIKLDRATVESREVDQ